jgi:hypothetical protein
VSTSIGDFLTFGWGDLDALGFWQYPCQICARHAEERDRAAGNTEYFPYHPFANPAQCLEVTHTGEDQ